MSQYTPEQVEECAEGYDALGEPVGAAMLKAYAATLRQAARVDASALPDYDAGLFGDGGGGDVGWWHDYLRAEIGRANDHWRENIEAALSAQPALNEPSGNSGELAQPAGEAVAWRFLGPDGSPVTEWADMPVRHGVSPGLLCPPIASVQYAYLHPAAPVGVPDAMPERTDMDGYSNGYVKGWNDCRERAIAAAPSAESGEVQ